MKRTVQKDQRGQILVIIAIMMPAMLAFVGLVIDGGYLYSEVRRTQATADATALAAATYVWKNTTANCTGSTASPDPCGAVNYAEYLGYTTANDSSVTVTHPAASSGAYATTEYASGGDYTRVDIQRTLPKYFIGIIFPALSQVNVYAIAAIARVPMEYALVSLADNCDSADNGTSPAVNGGIIVSGSSQLTVNNGAVHSNCENTYAINAAGSGDTFTSDAFTATGNCQKSSGATLTPDCEVGAASISDPMGTITLPCTDASHGNNATSPYCTTRSSQTGNADAVLEPGVYPIIEPSGSATLWLKTGIYVIRTSLKTAGSIGIKDCGATGAPAGCSGFSGGTLIFIANSEYDGSRANPCDDGSLPAPTNATLSLIGTSGFDLRAKTSGPYQGLAIWQGCGNSSTLQLQGNLGSQVVGSTYAPDALLKMGGNASWTTPSSIVSKFTQVFGSVILTINYDHTRGYKPWGVVLVE